MQQNHYNDLFKKVKDRKTPIVVEHDSLPALRSGLKRARRAWNSNHKTQINRNISIRPHKQDDVVISNQYDILLVDPDKAPFRIIH